MNDGGGDYSKENYAGTGTLNPLARSIDKVYGYGASLAGRVVREFVYEGWNRDLEGRRVFDAVQTHTGIGRLYLNVQKHCGTLFRSRQHGEIEKLLRIEIGRYGSLLTEHIQITAGKFQRQAAVFV